MLSGVERKGIYNPLRDTEAVQEYATGTAQQGLKRGLQGGTR